MRCIVLAALFIVSCATPAQRITSKLESVGVPSSQARCMGDKLASRLSYRQLDELNRVIRDSGRERLTLNLLVRRLANADPALVARLVETGLGCAI